MFLQPVPAFKIAILFLVAAVSLYIGYRLGPTAMAIRYDMDYYEYTPPLEYGQALYRYYYFLVGVLVTAMTLITSRLFRAPDIAALSVIFVASLFFRPLISMFEYGESLSFLSVIDILWFQVPYFAGMFAVFGVFSLFNLLVLSHFRNRNT